MKTMPSFEDVCLRVSELQMELAGGRVPTDGERAFLEEHLTHCAACRLERAAAEVLHFGPDASPAPDLDELTRRRCVSDAVSAALAGLPDAARGGPERGISAVPDRRSVRGRPWRLGALAAGLLLVVGVGAALVMVRSGPRDGSSPGGQGTAALGRLLLVAGEVRVDGEAPSAGLTLRAGQRVVVASGRVAMGLGGDAKVFAEGGASLRLVALGPAGTELRLERGEILVSVTPRRERAPFRVSTRAGQVEVMGTVFAVRVIPAAVSVRVARGQVQLTEPGRAPRALGRGQAAQLGGGAASVVSSEQEAEDERRVALMERLGAGDRVEMSIQSRPTGARVELDGALLGVTPLWAQVPPGHPLLRVSLSGRAEVQERLTARAGERITRDYELGPAPLAARGSTPATEIAALPKDPGVAMGGGPGVVTGGVPGVAAGGSPGVATGEGPGVAAGGSPSTPRVSAPGVSARSEPKDAQTLLGEARQHRMARDWSGAVRAYRRLLRHHGRSAEAPAARVALGLLLLDQAGDPRGALAQFDAYLAGTRQGPLAQEAAYGRIRALGRLGRQAEELAALRSFLHFYPGALQEPLVQKRLGALGTSGARPGASSTAPR